LAWLDANDPPPLVDVFICTYNEEEAILERTIIGAVAMDYRRFRVWVLDDGRRPWLAEMSARLGAGYLTRSDNAHAKAGNINNGLRHVAALPEPPAFISILDADFVPAPQFLRRTLALMRDSDVGIVQTPQHFTNPDPMQINLSAANVWPDEQRYFFDVVMASKDAWGAAFCCGTSSMLRFEVLQRIGGFPTQSVTEDYLVTLKMKQVGYRTIYLNEQFSLGLAPEGLKEYITQRSRWALGFMQIIRGPLGPLRRGNGFTLIDRINLLDTFLYWFGSYSFRMLGIIVPILFLLFNITAVQADVATTLSYYLPQFLALSFVTGWLAQSRVMPIMTD
jgi:cellulose synthase (UDP-forming)